ncbi:hypothetical protein [Halobacteriovorax sp. DA5]|uniref:hypothetical protein n=1 Tax=Halobacteriovorax sp. DA5 TaxID=2067553 RepID=UPI000CD2544E|nr:hypothetical protein [Halobacteriovorax sp. DA5]POB13406.1 hypothetical protein C0Z22_09590 [Halobacteriovorax sp. DA5]
MRTIVKSSKLLMLILAAAMTVQTHAQEEAKSKKDGDIDSEITNARLRAQSGSKSDYSLSLSLGYNGGTLDDIFGEERPDIYGDPETETKTSFGGSFAGRYRFNKNDSMTVGAGFSVLNPWGHSEGNVDNPYIGYSRIYKIGDFQTSTSADITFGTAESYKAVDLKQVVSASHNMMKRFEGTNLTVGASVSLSAYFYGSEPEVAVSKEAMTELAVGFYPQLEYVFNDTFSFRTVFGYFNYQKSRGEDSKLLRAYEYQSVGVGISVTRDIYVYPNIQFLADDLDADKTNFAISADINIL